MSFDPETRRQELYNLMGDLPDRERPITATTTGTDEHDGYLLEKLTLDLNGIEPVPAYFARPRDRSGPLPVILYNHSHGSRYAIGKDELLTAREYLQLPPYVEALTGLGYAVLAIDAWGFGGRYTRTESSIFKEMLWKGQVMWGMMVYDSLRAVDYLVSRADVDAARIGTLGMSMGSTMAWWVAALDPRVRVCVDICCLTDFDALIESGGLDGHGIYYYVPRLLNHFTTAQINALIAPRPHLGLAGNRDPLTPPQGLDRIDAELKQVYAEAGAPEAWQMLRYEVPHVETQEMRQAILAFLQRWL
ncbi:MAG: alpha/beta hydrolase [Chloroflexi bacterium]|nr:alpha/beta hydrolase [Chloroflexota bacterium]